MDGRHRSGNGRLPEMERAISGNVGHCQQRTVFRFTRSGNGPLPATLSTLPGTVACGLATPNFRDRQLHCRQRQIKIPIKICFPVISERAYFSPTGPALVFASLSQTSPFFPNPTSTQNQPWQSGSERYACTAYMARAHASLCTWKRRCLSRLSCLVVPLFNPLCCSHRLRRTLCAPAGPIKRPLTCTLHFRSWRGSRPSLWTAMMQWRRSTMT